MHSAGLKRAADRCGGRSAPARLPSLRDRRARYVVFFSIYLYQGLVAGFSLTALANHYAGLGLPAGEIGLHFAVAGLPWAVQPILWGPWIDRAAEARMGRRRFWAVFGLLGAQACLCGLCLLSGPNLVATGAVFLAHSLFASLVDTACDRMIMDHVPETELGRTSACSRGGFVVGTSLSAALFSWTLARYGLTQSALALLALTSVALVPPVLVREAPGDALFVWGFGAEGLARRRAPAFGRFLRRLLVGLRRPSALRMLALCFCVDGALALFELRFGVDLVQAQGWDALSLSRLQAVLALASGTLGALAVGLWVDRAGPLPALTGLFAGGALAFGIAAALIAADGIGAAGPAILGLTNVLPGLVVVALVPALMRASRRTAVAATQFEVFMATMNLGSVAGGAVSGPAARLPIAAVALLVLLVFAACAWLSRRPDLLFGSRGDPGP